MVESVVVGLLPEAIVDSREFLVLSVVVKPNQVIESEREGGAVLKIVLPFGKGSAVGVLDCRNAEVVRNAEVAHKSLVVEFGFGGGAVDLDDAGVV